MSRRTSQAERKKRKQVSATSSATLQAPKPSPPEAGVVLTSRSSVVARRAIQLVLVGGGLAAYADSFGGAFLLDDLRRIVDNPQIRHLWPPWQVIAGTSRPLVELSLALNYALGGLNVWG